MIYYINTNTNGAWWGCTLVAFGHHGDFHVSPAFEGMGITADTASVTLDGKSYLIETDSNYAASYFTDEELAFMIRCQGEFDSGEWDDVLADELVKRAVMEDYEAVYRNAAEILGVEI
nr:MAG TPA: hypothetical protein [Bacteriophage sp.]